MYLEKFSVPRVVKQGVELASMVPKEKWLADVLPGTLQRYRDIPHAIKNVGRVAVNRGMEGYIIREDRRTAALGIATVVFEQTLLLPKGAKLQATNLDYWLRGNVSHNNVLHFSTALELVDVAARDQKEPYYAFATTPHDHDYNRGLHKILPPHDGFGLLPGVEGDVYGVGWNNQTSQFYGRDIGMVQNSNGRNATSN